jgi:hypothetical protein
MSDTSFFYDPDIVWVALNCLFKANHKERNVLLNGVIVKLQPGEFISSYNSFLKATNKISPRTLRRCIHNLETVGFLTRKPTNKFTIFHIEKYDFYQFSNGETTSITTNKRQTNDKQTTTDNNDKNDKNEKKTSALSLLGEKSEEFKTAWCAFLEMRKKNQKEATLYAQKLILCKLEKLAPANEAKQIMIINQSIVKSWQDVFELKIDYKTEEKDESKKFTFR